MPSLGKCDDEDDVKASQRSGKREYLKEERKIKTIGAATNAVYTNSSPTPSIMGIVCPFPFLPPWGVLLSLYPLSRFRSVFYKNSCCSLFLLVLRTIFCPRKPPFLPRPQCLIFQALRAKRVSRRETKWHRLVETHHITSTFLLRVTMREGKAVPEAQEERERPTTSKQAAATNAAAAAAAATRTPTQPSPARQPRTLAKPRCRDDVSSCPGQVPIFLAQWHSIWGRE